MNKNELIRAIAEKSDFTLKDTEVLLSTFVEVVEETVANGEKVKIVGFGTFEPRERAGREGRNPKTQEVIQIPPTVTPAFSVGKEFKNLVKEKLSK